MNVIPGEQRNTARGKGEALEMDHPDLRSALIGKIQDLDVSQREAADAIGVSQQALSSWVSGDSIPSRQQSPRLAKWLDLPEETIRRMRLTAAENQHGNAVGGRLDHIEDELDSLVRQVEDVRRAQHRFVETVLRLLPSIAAGALKEDVAGGVGDLFDQLQRIETPQTRHESD
jgi:transcriptional regulator with XRE-family HTH domain